MKRKFILTILLIFIICGNVGCAQKIVMKEQPVTLDGLLTKRNEECKKALKEPIKYSVKKYVNSSPVKEFTNKEIKVLTAQGNADFVTKKQATADVNTLFQLLKSSYAGYLYFGGDRVFNLAKENCINSIDEEVGTKLSNNELKKILLSNLSFIKDSHLTLDGQNTNFQEDYYYCENSGIELQKDTKGYYKLIKNKKWYIENEMEKNLRITIGKTGELKYRLFSLCKEEKSNKLPKLITLAADKDKKKFRISWSRANAGSKSSSESYHYEELDGFPVVSLNEMDLDMNSVKQMNRFINGAKKLRDRDMFILDLRRNYGGISEINLMWLYNLTGQLVEQKMEEMIRYSTLNDYVLNQMSSMLGAFYLFDFYKENLKLVNSIIIDRLYEWSTLSSGKDILKTPNPKWIERKGTIFVLIDKETYSAGEIFLFQLSTIANVVLVGTNSNGCLVTGNTTAFVPIYLPNSKISVIYGQSLFGTDIMNNYDVKGMQPDITIGDEDAIKAVIRCYQYYNEK